MFCLSSLPLYLVEASREKYYYIIEIVTKFHWDISLDLLTREKAGSTERQREKRACHSRGQGQASKIRLVELSVLQGVFTLELLNCLRSTAYPRAGTELHAHALLVLTPPSHGPYT